MTPRRGMQACYPQRYMVARWELCVYNYIYQYSSPCVCVRVSIIIIFIQLFLFVVCGGNMPSPVLGGNGGGVSSNAVP